MSTPKRRVTINDVAQKAQVSAMTVSRVLNNKGEISEATRQHVLEVVDELGYRPSRVARGLATNQTFTIGLVVPNIAHGFFAEIALGAEVTTWEHGYNLILYNTGENWDREEAALKLLEETRADGIIVCSARLPDERLFPLLEQHRAVVLFNRPAPSNMAAVVRMDDLNGTIQATTHLINSGCHHISYLGGTPCAYAQKQRAKGFANAMREAGRTINPDLQTTCPPQHYKPGYAVARELLIAHPEIDGFVCFNDFIAVGALQACTELGRRVPDDIAIVGCDDILLAQIITPTLTTLSVSKHDIGTITAELLLERIQGKRKQEEVVIKQELIVRQSAP